MKEYAYTVNMIENELTYEQLFLFVHTIKQRKQKQSQTKTDKAINIQDIAEGKANIDFPLERVTK